MMVVLGIALGALFVPTGGALAVKAIQDVVVTNGDSNPVPTKSTGTTQVQGTVGLNGPVALSGPVKVDGPVKVEQASREPWSLSGLVQKVPQGDVFRADHASVPAGKDMVVTHVSTQTSGFPSGVEPRLVQVRSYLPGPREQILHVPMFESGGAWTGSEEVDFYISDEVTFYASADQETNASIAFSLSGYLVVEQ